MKTANHLELLLMVKELEIQQLKKRIQEHENPEFIVIGQYGMRGVGKTYYERNKNKAKGNKRTRRNSRSS